MTESLGMKAKQTLRVIFKNIYIYMAKQHNDVICWYIHLNIDKSGVSDDG